MWKLHKSRRTESTLPGLDFFGGSGILDGNSGERKKDMTDFPYDGQTKLINIWEAHPWLSEVLPGIDARFSIMNTAVGKILMKRNSVADLSKVAGIPVETLLQQLRREVERHEP